MIKNGKILMNITAFLNVYQTMVVENGRMTLWSASFFSFVKARATGKVV